MMERVKSEATEARNRAVLVAAPWIEKLARIGYYAKGVVYVLLGILAVRAAIDMNSESASSTGAFRAIAEEPFGRILLFAIAVGLAGYTAWRAVQAIKDPEQHESGARGRPSRASSSPSARSLTALSRSRRSGLSSAVVPPAMSRRRSRPPGS